jgi:hypothetical protein
MRPDEKLYRIGIRYMHLRATYICTYIHTMLYAYNSHHVLKSRPDSVLTRYGRGLGFACCLVEVPLGHDQRINNCYIPRKCITLTNVVKMEKIYVTPYYKKGKGAIYYHMQLQFGAPLIQKSPFYLLERDFGSEKHLVRTLRLHRAQ